MKENKNVSSKIWIVPNNDLEAKTIIELLEKNGENYIVTSQGWGASWEMLEPEVFEQLKGKGFEIEDEYIGYLREMDQKVQEIDAEILQIYDEIYANEGESEAIIESKQKIAELESIKAEILEKRKSMASDFLFSINRQANEKSISIYGVELKGLSRGAIDIDHHTYGEDDRSNLKSSIEQVTEVLGADLSVDEQFVSANDKGYIPAMEKLGEKLGIEGEDLQEIISNIRMRDRQMQGITLEQEAQAQEKVETLGNLEEKRDYILVDSLPHSKSATITDRLYGKYDNLLITSTDGETNFFGSAEIIKMLDEKFPGGWSGGQLEQGNGFWGGYADQEAIKEAVQAIVEKIREQNNQKEKIKEFWLQKYSKDKIGTIAKLSQAMQHGAWLREWQRVHGNAARIKPITQKVNDEEVKVGESDIAVPWSQLHEFFRQGNEYGDIETVKFLSERIESGNIGDLRLEELYDLSKKENVKWSGGKHSINPLQGYLYTFTKPITGKLNMGEAGTEYGHFVPMDVYMYGNNGPTDNDVLQSLEDDAYSRVFATKLIQKFIKKEGKEEEYKDSLIFNITDAKTPEQIIELDKQIVDVVHTSKFEYFMDEIEKNAKYEKKIEKEIKEEVEVEIKKDSDRIENAHKVFVALETGNLDEILEDLETAKWAQEVYEREIKTKDEEEI